MPYVAAGLVAFVGIEHIYIMVLEMFLWAKPAGIRTFRRTKEEQEATKVLAANQGLYNGFLAAGLLGSFLVTPEVAYTARLFFLGCVVVAGVYGGLTAVKRILYVQALPAAVALVSVVLAHLG